jgi:hypothetical protein
MATNFSRSSVEWGRTTTGYNKYVFALDRDTGIWRSDDWGSSWELIFSPGNLSSFFPSGEDFIGFIALDPNETDGRVVFTNAIGLHIIEDAYTCNPNVAGTTPNTCSFSRKGSGSLPSEYLGPVAFTPDGTQLAVIGYDLVSGVRRGEIWTATDAATGWTQVSVASGDDDVLDATIHALNDLAITPSETLYASSRGQGVIVINNVFD